jgi:DNA-binding FadR family transcriptional regulator
MIVTERIRAMDQRSDIWQIAAAHSRDGLLRQFRQAREAGLLRPGDRLPNERLAAQLSGLSRSTVRVVFGVLERDGHIVRQVGRGTYVADMQRAEPARNGDDLPTPAELMAFRLITEPALVDLAVLTATDAQLEDLAAVARFGRHVTQWQHAEDADRRFHQAIFNATGNRLFVELGERLSAARDSRSWLRLKEGSFSPEKWAIYQQEHEVIVAALTDRNAEMARNALRRHLGGVRANVQTVTWEL